MNPPVINTAMIDSLEPVASKEVRHEPPTIKVAGWTCVNTRLSIPPTPIDSPDASEDEEVTAIASTTIDDDETSRSCEWEGCSATFTGVNAPTLLYLHIVNNHVGRSGETQSFDPKCHWSGCPYSGKIRRLLLSHVIVHVPDYKPVACEECGRAFQRESTVRQHKKTCKGS